MGSLKKRRKAKINKHKRSKRMRQNRVTSPKVCALRCSNWQSVRFPENSGVLLIAEGRRFLYGHSFCIIFMDSLIKLFLFFTAS
mgnify:CR=1 FL=1